MNIEAPRRQVWLQESFRANHLANLAVADLQKVVMAQPARDAVHVSVPPTEEFLRKR
jgi:hypothetical protein